LQKNNKLLAEIGTIFHDARMKTWRIIPATFSASVGSCLNGKCVAILSPNDGHSRPAPGEQRNADDASGGCYASDDAEVGPYEAVVRVCGNREEMAGPEPP